MPHTTRRKRPPAPQPIPKATNIREARGNVGLAWSQAAPWQRAVAVLVLVGVPALVVAAAVGL